MSVGKALAQRRKELGLSQRGLADACDCSASFVCQVENDKLMPSLESLRRLAAELGTSVAALMEGEGANESRRASSSELTALVDEALGIIELFRNKSYRQAEERLTQLKMQLPLLGLHCFDYLCDYYLAVAGTEARPDDRNAYEALRQLESTIITKKQFALLPEIYFKFARYADSHEGVEVAKGYLKRTVEAIDDWAPYQALMKIKALANLAAEHSETGAVARAEEYNSGALEAVKKTPETVMLGAVLANAGYYSMCLGDYSKAEKQLFSALTFAGITDDECLKANVTSNAGLLDIRRGDFSGGIEKLRVAVNLYERQQRYSNLAITYSEMAAAYIKAGNYVDAFTHCRRAFALARKHDLKFLKASGYHSLGLILSHNGRKGQAIKALEKAAILYAEHGVTGKLPEIYSKMSEIYLDLGNTDKVREYIRKTQECTATN